MKWIKQCSNHDIKETNAHKIAEAMNNFRKVYFALRNGHVTRMIHFNEHIVLVR